MTPSLPSRQDVLAASSAWLAALLNVVPGLGTGYIYQRRWRAYWITSAVTTTWFLLGALLRDGAEMPDGRDQLIGLGGLVLVAIVTAVEAARTARRARGASVQ